MQCRFSFKHMKSSDALSEYAEGKLVAKIEKYSTKPIEAHVTFSVEGHQHKAHVGVKGGDGFNFQVDAVSPDMYASIDSMAHKLEAQLKKQKEKLKNHKNQVGVRQLEPQSPVLEDAEAVDAADVLKLEQARANASNE